MNRIRLSIFAALVALCLALIASASASAATLTLSGSTSIAPLATKLAKAFVKKNKGTKFVILQGGSDIGITDVSRGRVTLGMSSRDPKEADPGGIVFNKFARDAVCVVTNPGNPLPGFSQTQVQDIFSGRVRSWSDVEGSGISGPIDLVVRTAASGTQDAFQNIFMGLTLRVAGSADDESVERPPGTDGQIRPERDRIRVVQLHPRPLRRPLSGRSVHPAQRQVRPVPGTRNFYFVSRGRATGVAKEFINFARSAAAAPIVSSDWVPLR